MLRATATATITATACGPAPGRHQLACCHGLAQPSRNARVPTRAVKRQGGLAGLGVRLIFPLAPAEQSTILLLSATE